MDVLARKSLAPGARITLRDEDWIIRRIDQCDDGGYALTCDGLSELVRGTTSIFLDRLEGRIDVHDPADTELFLDDSPFFNNALLYLESQRLRTVANDERIHRAHQGVMKEAAYQRVPTDKGLKQVRTRILIADGVGLGKTLEAAMLATELDIRGRGRRILVVTQKSMLTQFQKEWWSRFSIPLVRLDSTGIQRIRNQIPSGHNPFNYYDKTIISMDTLKGNIEYRNYLDQSRWDIIVIDECHNVAIRKSDAGSSLRARLAKNLATKSDSLILLSATPHDGSATSFASLIWLLDPTAISDPEEYTREDLERKDLFVRRFKKDIVGQAEGQFHEPVTRRISADANEHEDAAYRLLVAVPFTQAGQAMPGSQSELQRVGLQKALFSSPSAARVSVNNRIEKLSIKSAPSADEEEEVRALRELAKALEQITAGRFSKYQAFLTSLRDPESAWKGLDAKDRLVVFSERIETLKWLYENLPGDLNLPADSFVVMDGSLSDIDQQEIVERFGQEHDGLRVLLCSDVASEGLNLHFLCHRLVHFDLPWSPMVFQQRNGRVDRFGQESIPRIDYLLTRSNVDKVKGELRVIEVLVKKDEQISKNIGDPASVLRKHNIEGEEKLIAEVLAEGVSAEEFEAEHIDEFHADVGEDDWETAFFDDSGDQGQPSLPSALSHQFFPGSYEFAQAALSLIPEADGFRKDDRMKMLRITPPSDLRRRLRQQLPAEVLRETKEYTLSAIPGDVEEAIQRAREEDCQGATWPDIQYLWPQHPIFQWMVDRVIGSVGRRRAPVILSDRLATSECAFLMLGLIPNRKGQPLIAEWKAIVSNDSKEFGVEDFDHFCERAEIRSNRLANSNRARDLTALQGLLGDAVATMQLHVEERVKTFSESRTLEVNQKLAELEELRRKQEQQLELRLEGLLASVREGRKARRLKDIGDVFKEYGRWIQDALEVEPVPFVQVLAVVVPQVTQ